MHRPDTQGLDDWVLLLFKFFRIPVKEPDGVVEENIPFLILTEVVGIFDR
jgi:hypothetical protein